MSGKGSRPTLVRTKNTRQLNQHPFKTRLQPLALVLFTAGLLSLPAHAQLAANALPSAGVVAAGSATIGTAGNAMTINQASNKAIIDWQNFNIGRDASVRFNQPSVSSVVLNRVGADGGRSLIDGNLSANGQVWLLNPGGMLFGPTATINTGGLLASTLAMGNEDFLGGNVRFIKDSKGGTTPASIINQGKLTAADGGYVALLAPEVRNEGIITARLGTVALASGNELRLDFTGDRLIEIRVDQSAVNGLIENKNLVETEGGWVLMSAGAASSLGAGGINNTGIVRASSLVEHAGMVRLEGGFVALGGSISADGTAGAAGGTVQVHANRDLSLADSVSAQSTGGAGGSVGYSVGGKIIETSTSYTNASGHTDGGSIRVSAEGGILSSGHYNASGASGHGGQIAMSGENVRLLSATLDATGATQGGLVRVGGEFQGGKPQESSSEAYQRYIGRNVEQFGALPGLTNAQRTFVNDSSRIDVSASAGTGGTAIVWSDKETTLLGSIDARGGLNAGTANGGAVEISSADHLRHASLSSVTVGPGGAVLLDPKNITIADSATTVSTWSYAAIIGSGYSGGKNVDVSSLEASDFFGTSVAINASGDRLAVGTYADDGFGNVANSSGSVRLFSFGDTSFSGGALQSTIGKGYIGGKNVDVSSLETGDNFGMSLALNASGDRLAVGAIADGGFGNIALISGAVHLFSFGDTSFSGGTLQATLGKGYSGGKNVDVSNLEGSDYFGQSVALNASGDRLAVGAVDDGFGNLASTVGAVYLFSFGDTNFGTGALQGIIGKGYSGGKNVNVSSLETNDYFGASVALNASGDRLAVGAQFDDGFGNVASGSGAVHLFSFGDTSFSGGTLLGTMGWGYSGGKSVDVNSLQPSDLFGSSIALNASGDRLAVGASQDDGFGNPASDSGAVRLFSFSDTSFSGGALQGTIGKGYTGGKNVDVSSLEAGDGFGYSVALNASGDRLAVGSILDDGFGNTKTNSGAVHLFSFTDTSFNGGALQATIGYGGSKNVNVALEGGTSTYPNLGDLFGSGLALNAAGDRLAVGAAYDDGFGNAYTLNGAVRLFSFTDTNFSGGTLQATLGRGYTGGKNMDVVVPLPGGGGLATAKHFGASVSLNANGDRLAVGANGDGTDSGRGAVMLFSFGDTNFSSGVLESSFCNTCIGGKNYDVSDLTAWVRFGSGVSLNGVGDRLAVGAYQDNGPIDNGRGSVRLYSFTDNRFSGAAQEALLTSGATGGKNIDVALDVADFFGTHVSLNAVGDRLAVGAYGDDGAANTANGAGAVRLFSFSDANFSGGTLQATLGKGYTGGKNIDVSGLEAGDHLSSVALNAVGDQLAVGAGADAGFGNVAAASGAVRLFNFTDTNFTGGT